MTKTTASLRDFTADQVRNLCDVVGLKPVDTVLDLIGSLLGPAGERFLDQEPLWPSDVSDDTTPLEWSVSFDAHGNQRVRVLGETIAVDPGPANNAAAARCLLDRFADEHAFGLDRFREVEDLFLPSDPQGKFSLWFSLIFPPDSPPKFKIYLNPSVRGPGRERELVAEALRRLDLSWAYQVVSENGLRRGQLDQPAFFSLDLDGSSRSRVKIYVAHQAATVSDVVATTTGIDGVDPEEIRRFCSIVGGGPGPYTRRPLISSYTFADDFPRQTGNYSLYLPVRDYVADDAEAYQRARELMTQKQLAPAQLDRLLSAVSQRPLGAATGLIAHMALRLGLMDPGVTVYLSSEAYGGTPWPHGESQYN